MSKAGVVSVRRVSEVRKEVDLCRKWLPRHFRKEPERLSIILYASRVEFVQGLIDELGFSKSAADYFKESSAPRPIKSKLLVPPDMELKNIFHEIVHHYLESNAPREKLLNAKWFDEGVASYLAALYNGENFYLLKKSFVKQSGGKLIPIGKMITESDWHELHKNPQFRSLAYRQVLFMVKYFCDKYSVGQFRNLLVEMNSETFESAFHKVCGITQEEFFTEWSEKQQACKFRSIR